MISKERGQKKRFLEETTKSNQVENSLREEGASGHQIKETTKDSDDDLRRPTSSVRQAGGGTGHWCFTGDGTHRSKVRPVGYFHSTNRK